MSYMALYRKWRPDTFEEVKGQDHVVTTLKNQIINNRIGHAFLFCGTRGTGKTSIAKLFAKAVNCEHPVNGSPCNECAACRAIADGSSMNVIEIDAASNNGVDNIRQIREEVQYSPSEGKYKVYIIDEVHMLTQGAFNALLKTLEEPPSYVIFILATTESHKIPITISSRCQKYEFRRISVETISDRLMELLGREQIAAEKKAIDYVAKAADGSMRDALSILDQCIAFNIGKELTYENVLDTIGAVDIDVFARLLDCVIRLDVVGAIDLVATRYGVQVQGATNIALTKLDILSYMDKIPVCAHYELDGQQTDEFPFPVCLQDAKPVIEYVDGWKCDISKVRSWDELPENARNYVEYVERAIGCHIGYVSVGAERDSLIIR